MLIYHADMLARMLCLAVAALLAAVPAAVASGARADATMVASPASSAAPVLDSLAVPEPTSFDDTIATPPAGNFSSLTHHPTLRGGAAAPSASCKGEYSIAGGSRPTHRLDSLCPPHSNEQGTVRGLPYAQVVRGKGTRTDAAARAIPAAVP